MPIFITKIIFFLRFPNLCIHYIVKVYANPPA